MDVHKFFLRIPTELHAALKAEAAKQDRSVNWLVTKAVQSALGKNDEINRRKNAPVESSVSDGMAAGLRLEPSVKAVQQ